MAVRNPLRCVRDTSERIDEIRQIDHCQQKADNPENVLVCEQRYKAKNRNNFKLQFLVAHPFGKRVQPEEKNAQQHDGDRSSVCSADSQSRMA